MGIAYFLPTRQSFLCQVGWMDGWRRLDCCYLGVMPIWFVCLPSLLVYRNIEERSATGFIFLCVIVCDRQLTELKITISRVYICNDVSMWIDCIWRPVYISWSMISHMGNLCSPKTPNPMLYIHLYPSSNPNHQALYLILPINPTTSSQFRCPIYPIKSNPRVIREINHQPNSPYSRSHSRKTHLFGLEIPSGRYRKLSGRGWRRGLWLLLLLRRFLGPFWLIWLGGMCGERRDVGVRRMCGCGWEDGRIWWCVRCRYVLQSLLVRTSLRWGPS